MPGTELKERMFTWTYEQQMQHVIYSRRLWKLEGRGAGVSDWLCGNPDWPFHLNVRSTFSRYYSTFDIVTSSAFGYILKHNYLHSVVCVMLFLETEHQRQKHYERGKWSCQRVMLPSARSSSVGAFELHLDIYMNIPLMFPLLITIPTLNRLFALFISISLIVIMSDIHFHSFGYLTTSTKRSEWLMQSDAQNANKTLNMRTILWALYRLDDHNNIIFTVNL